MALESGNILAMSMSVHYHVDLSTGRGRVLGWVLRRLYFTEPTQFFPGLWYTFDYLPTQTNIQGVLMILN